MAARKEKPRCALDGCSRKCKRHSRTYCSRSHAMMGQRVKIDDVKQRTIIAAIRAGAGIRIAAETNSLSARAVFALMERDEGFREQVKEAREFAVELIETSMHTMARSNVQAARYFLNNRAADRWKEKQEHVIGGDEDAPLVFRAFLADGSPITPAPDDIPGEPGDESGE